MIMDGQARGQKLLYILDNLEKYKKKSTPQEHTFYEREYTKYAYYFPQTYYCIKRK